MFWTLALSSAAGLVGLLPTALDSSPPSTDPASETTDGQAVLDSSLEFERKLAELAFALYLGDELAVDAGTYACTEPSSLTVGEPITCFTLIGSERVVVAETQLTGTSGVYEFEIISDHQIGSDETTPTDPGPSTTALPTPVLITTAPLSQADADLLAYGAQIDEDAVELIGNLISDDGIVASADYSWDRQTATVARHRHPRADLRRRARRGGVGHRPRSSIDLWSRDSPFRAAGSSIRPGLEVTVDGVRFVSDFDLCVQVADQTITMTDWLAKSRGPGLTRPNRDQTEPGTVSLNAVSTGPRRRISMRQIDAGDRCDRQAMSIVAPRAHATAALIGETWVTTATSESRREPASSSHASRTRTSRAASDSPPLGT